MTNPETRTLIRWLEQRPELSSLIKKLVAGGYQTPTDAGEMIVQSAQAANDRAAASIGGLDPQLVSEFMAYGFERVDRTALGQHFMDSKL